MTATGRLKGRRVLVVEDEFFLAEDLARGLTERGAQVVGPSGDVEDALDLIEETERLDAAVLDLNLRGEMAFPVADALLERGVRFVFTTGYDPAGIPPRYRGVVRCEKPADAGRIARALFG